MLVCKRTIEKFVYTQTIDSPLVGLCFYDCVSSDISPFSSV
jgi:hypothetical protein